MGLKFYNPTSPGRRLASVSDFAEITRDRPEKSLVERIPGGGGRNATGYMTVKHRGGGARKLYRKVDFRREKDGVPGRVASIEYDPNRSGRIALLCYKDGEKRYILAPDGLKVGEELLSGPEAEPKTGNCLPLRRIPPGIPIHAIELAPGRGAQMVRSAGTVAQLAAKEGDYAHVVFPSGEIRKIHLDCRATVGQVGNLDHVNVRIGKAGRNRHRGIRPHVRGVAMNPVDHPLGGGDGRSHGGRHPVSATGVLAKGGKTRNPRKNSSRRILRRRTPGPRTAPGLGR